MGNKTSYRRLNVKQRDPMAQDLADDKYHQRVVPKKRKGDSKFHEDEWEEDA